MFEALPRGIPLGETGAMTETTHLPSIRGLTLTQPWASSMALGYKRVETRSWRTAYRGWLAIHAAKGFPRDARAFAAEERAFGRMISPIPCSAIVAICHLDDCRPTEEAAFDVSAIERRLGDYSPGRYAWFTSKLAGLVEPIPCRGALSLWQLPSDIEARLQAVILMHEDVL